MGTVAGIGGISAAIPFVKRDGAERAGKLLHDSLLHVERKP